MRAASFIHPPQEGLILLGSKAVVEWLTQGRNHVFTDVILSGEKRSRW
jgi:hypothetical protein